MKKSILQRVRDRVFKPKVAIAKSGKHGKRSPPSCTRHVKKDVFDRTEEGKIKMQLRISEEMFTTLYTAWWEKLGGIKTEDE